MEIDVKIDRALEERFITYRYIGPGYMNGVPARDLYPADIADVERREHITRAQIEASGIYEPMETAEVKPFCGAPLVGSGRCKREVAAWGMRCWQHLEVTEEDENDGA